MNKKLPDKTEQSSISQPGLKYSHSVHISTQYMQIPLSQTQIQKIQSGKKRDKLQIIPVHLKTPSIHLVSSLVSSIPALTYFNGVTGGASCSKQVDIQTARTTPKPPGTPSSFCWIGLTPPLPPRDQTHVRFLLIGCEVTSRWRSGSSERADTLTAKGRNVPDVAGGRDLLRCSCSSTSQRPVSQRRC